MDSTTGRISGDKEAGLIVLVEEIDARCSSLEPKRSCERVTGRSADGDETGVP